MMLDGGNDNRDRSRFTDGASYQVLTEDTPRDDGITGPDALAASAGSRKYAAAEASQPAMQAIGHAVRIEGHVSVVRNGVVVTINNGDVLLKGDVVQTAGDGVAGLVFNDGSAFQIGHDSRLMLSEFSNGPGGYLQVFDLVQGSFSFASGKIAKLGDMRIGTPIGSTKITGSAGAGDVGADDGAVTLSIFAQDDGLHQATAYDRNGNTVATISSDGGRWVMKPRGPSQLAADEQAKTDADKAAESVALNNILQIQGLGEQFGSSSPDSTGAFGSSTPPGEFTDPGFGKLTFQLDGSNPSGKAFEPDSGGPANGGTSGLPGFDILVPVNEAPVLELNAGPAPLAALEQVPVAIVSGLTLSDVDSTIILQATVKIAGNFRPGEDVLSFVNTARIQGAFDPATGTLTLTARPGQGPTVADFEAALRSVTYTDTSDNSSPMPRTLTLTVQDADGTANGGHDTSVAILSMTVTPVNDVPVITTAQTAGAVREDIAVDSQGQLLVEGTVDFRDVDLTDRHVVSAQLVSSTNTGGVALGTIIAQLTSETVDGLGGKVTWHYLADNAGVQFLRAGQTITEIYAVTISDGHGGLATQNLAVTLTGSEDGPQLTAASSAANEDVNAAAQQVALAGTLSVTDLDLGDMLTASIVNSPAVTLDGQAFVLPAGALSLIDHALSFQQGFTSNGGAAHIDWTYDPSAANLDFLRQGQNLVLTYTVEVGDGLLSSGTQTLSIIITGTDDEPIIAAGAGAAVDEATDAHAQVISLAGALAVTDLDVGDTLTASVVGTPTVSLDGHAFTLPPDAMALTDGGAFAVDNSGGGHSSNGGATNIGWTYRPDAANLDFLKQGQTLTITYAVVVNDGTPNSAAQHVTITINGKNDAPVAAADGYATDEDTPLLVPVLGLLGNDTDADGDVLSSILLSGPAHGALALNDDGTFTYTPFANYNGADSFTYTANDGFADSASATVDITINAVNDRAIVSGTRSGPVVEAGGVNNVTAGTPTATGTLTDSDVDNPPNTFAAVTTATASIDCYGTWTITAAGVWTYTLDNNNPTVQALKAGITLTDTFTVTTIDGTPQLVTITIDGANDAAVLSADTRLLTEGNAVLSTGGTLTIAMSTTPRPLSSRPISSASTAALTSRPTAFGPTRQARRIMNLSMD